MPFAGFLEIMGCGLHYLAMWNRW